PRWWRLGALPSCVRPLPRSEWYETASPCASNVTASGAAPEVVLAEIVTLGGPAVAGAATASTTRTTAPAARSTHRPYALIRSGKSPLPDSNRRPPPYH